jgi:hypothetical protein
MPPGLNLSRYERPLAERRLLDDAVLDRRGALLPSDLPVREVGEGGLQGFGQGADLDLHLHRECQ